MAEQSGNNAAETVVRIIDRPQEAGDSVVILTPGQAVSFEFDLDEVIVSQSGSDIVLLFPDGGRITLVSESGFGDTQFRFLDGLTATESSLFSGGVPGQQDPSDGIRVVEKPEAGESVLVTIQPGQSVSFGFDVDSAEVLQSDSDIILLFEDGSQITLQSVLSAAASDAPPLVLLNDGTIVTAEELLASAGGGLDALANDLGDIAPASGPDNGPPTPTAPDNSSQIDSGPLDGGNPPTDSPRPIGAGAAGNAPGGGGGADLECFRRFGR